MSGRLKSVVPVLLGVIAYASYVGWKEFGASPRVTAAQTRTVAPSLHVSAADSALNDKLQPIIKCLNRVDTAMTQNIAAYHEHVRSILNPPKPGTIVINTNSFSSFKIAVYERNNDMSNECADGLDKAVAMKPVDAELDVPARTYATTLRALIPLMNEADLYYAQKDHADDKMAKGKKLDAQMKPLFATLERTSAALRLATNERDARLKENSLVAQEKATGRTLDWHALNLMVVARRAMTELEMGPLDKATVTAIEGRLQLAFDEGRVLAEAQAPANPSQRKPLWTSLQSGGSELLLAIKEVRRALEAGQKADIERVQKRYNSLVSSHNLMAAYAK